MRRSLLTSNMGLALMVAAASLANSLAQAEPQRSATPNRQRPTKAEKKAAKRARTRGVTPSDGGQQS